MKKTRSIQRWLALALSLALMLMTMPLAMVSAATATDTLISQFSYSGGTAGTDVPGDKDAGYGASLGAATVFASVNGTNARKLEWTNDAYTCGTATAVQPTMTAGTSNPWAAGAYVQVKLSTTGYTGIKFSAQLGGTKKGPRDFKLQYSTNGVSFTDVGVTYAITTNKVMEQAFSSVSLPAAADNAATLYIRMTVNSDTMISGTTGLAGATGGETAVNNIIVTGTGTAKFFPQGDINKDGSLTSTDIRQILNAVAGKTSYADQYALLADIDGDGNLSASDVRVGLRTLTGDVVITYRPVSNGATDVPIVADTTTKITLNGSSIAVDGSGVIVSGTTAAITAAGSYIVSGTLTSGQLIVAADSAADKVEITLNGVSITCQNSAPFYSQSADKTKIILADGTTNTLTDSTNYVFSAGGDEPNAALFSKGDLSIEGTGTLVVNANYNNGIATKDDLNIKGGTIRVNAVNNGIKGKDSIEMTGGDVTVVSKGDGMQTDNATDITKGFITIDDGSLNITAANDAIQADTIVAINGGTITAVTGGGSGTSPSSSDTSSYKGIKGNIITSTGGSVTLNCKDDAIHAAASVELSGGVFSVSSGDDGVHSDAALIINDPTALTVSKSYEALEGVDITVNGGTMRVTASDDGVNAAGGTDDGNGYWYVKDNLLYVVSTSSSGTSFQLATNKQFTVNTQQYLVLDYNATTGYDIVFDIKSSGATGSPSLSTDWYGGLGATASQVSGGYLPATNASKTAALDMKGYFDWNGTPSDGVATVKDIVVKLQGAGSICLGALQLSDNDSIGSFGITGAGTTITTTSQAGGNILNLLEGTATTATSTGSISTGTTQPGGMQSETYGSLTINGGYLAVYAGGDGLDCNGSMVMTGGTAIVHGPTDNGNGALDYDGTCNVTGGLLIAAGSSGMAQTPSTSSSQYTLNIKPSTSKSGGTLVGIKDASGNTILAFTPSKTYQSVVVCSPLIKSGTSYTAYTGGSATGTETDGLYTGTYTAGTSVGTATVSSKVTSLGSGGGGFNPRP